MPIYDLTLVAQKRTISPKIVSFRVGKSIIFGSRLMVALLIMLSLLILSSSVAHSKRRPGLPRTPVENLI